MGKSVDKSSRMSKLELEPLKKEKELINYKIKSLSNLDDISRLKLLLLYIKHKALNNDIHLVYRAIRNKSVMFIYLYENDLLVILSKPMIINDNAIIDRDYKPEEKVVKVYLDRISSYGGHSNSMIFKNEELQFFLKDLFYILINNYYDNLTRLDNVIDKTLSLPEKNSNNIIKVLIEEQLSIDKIKKEEISKKIKEFDNTTITKSAKFANRKKPVFF